MKYTLLINGLRRQLEDDILSVAKSNNPDALCDLKVSGLPDIPLDFEQARSIGVQDFNRSLTAEHKGGCHECFWKFGPSDPCDSLLPFDSNGYKNGQRYVTVRTLTNFTFSSRESKLD